MSAQGARLLVRQEPHEGCRGVSPAMISREKRRYFRRKYIMLHFFERKGVRSMAHMEKFNMEAASHMFGHYERSSRIHQYSNSEIDKERSGENYNLGPEREEGQSAYVRKKLEEIAHANRKDLVVMSTLLITEPKDLPREYREEFFKATYAFCVDRYGGISGMGEDVVVSSYVQWDESPPPMHFAFLPVKADTGGKRFCAKEVICRAELKTLHSDLEKWLTSRGIPARVLNGKTKYDSGGKVMSVKELKRETARERQRTKSGSRWTDGRTAEKERTVGRW